MTEPWSAEPECDTVVIEVTPGTYKACAFGFSTQRNDTAIVVLCRTDEIAPNKVAAVDSIFM